ncbi:hypothetical protein D6817_04655 [Candidatus Pacearchaeota archaeon]|nr:MAG: hypothetical protein D6817_04655 [Candidatus Pacearchaeota archaeon]
MHTTFGTNGKGYFAFQGYVLLPEEGLEATLKRVFREVEINSTGESLVARGQLNASRILNTDSDLRIDVYLELNTSRQFYFRSSNFIKCALEKVLGLRGIGPWYPSEVFMRADSDVVLPPVVKYLLGQNVRVKPARLEDIEAAEVNRLRLQRRAREVFG